MLEIPYTFRRIEHANVRPDASLEPFDCALRSFAQECLQGREHRLDWVKLRRILRQIAEACTTTPDRLLYTCDLVEGNIVGHDNVSTLERRHQTLLYVSQEGFAIHGSFDQHRSHEASLTRPAINVTVSQCPMGASANRRSPRGLQPLRRTILVVTAVSSINTRLVVSSQPCSRIQRRRARATSARFRSAARRLFFKGDAMASEESRQRAAAPRDTSLVQYRNDLIQGEVRLLAENGEDVLRILLQGGSAPSTGHWFGSPIFAKALHPSDRGTDADPELFGRLTSGSSSLHEFNDARSQLPRIRSPHWPAPAESCVRLAPPTPFANPDSLPSGRAVERQIAKVRCQLVIAAWIGAETS